MSNLDVELINKTVRDIRDRRSDGKSIEDIVALAELSAESLKNFYQSIDNNIYSEIRGYSDHLSVLKRNISRLKTGDSGTNRISRAIGDLQEVVSTTENATDTIMEQAEEMLSLSMDPTNPNAYQAAVTNHVTSIFEACSFQDLTGQRIQRVVTSLERLEERLNQINEVLNLQAGSTSNLSIMETETTEDKRQRENLLHGPSSDGEGVGQSLVDAIFAIESKRAAF